MSIYDNSATVQRERILNFLHARPLDTLTARKELDVMHPAGRVMELRKQGIGIKTVKIDRLSDCGEIHRIACYVLDVGAAATARTDKVSDLEESETGEAK